MSFLDIQKIIIEIANKNIRAKERKKKKINGKKPIFFLFHAITQKE